MITIYKPAGVTVEVIEGNPPVDQSALVASLQAQVATLTDERDDALEANASLQAQVATLTAERNAALAANLPLQAEIADLEAQITVARDHITQAAAAPAHLESALQALQ